MNTFDLVHDIDSTFEFKEPTESHLLDKEDVTRGYVLGEVVTALCGYSFIPTRDPQKFPLCSKCKDIFNEMIRGEYEF